MSDEKDQIIKTDDKNAPPEVQKDRDGNYATELKVLDYKVIQATNDS